MVALRWGSFEKFDRVVNSYGAIARYMGRSVQTVHRCIKSFEQNDYQVVLLRKQNGAEPRIKSPMKEILLSTQWLRTNFHLNLKDRCELIHKQFGISISPTTLSKFYKSNGIVRGTPKYVYESAIRNRAELDQERHQFARSLATILRRGDPVIYFDETSLSAWTKKKRVWGPKHQPMEFGLHWKRFKGVTLMGALSNNIRDKVFFTMTKSTNHEDFKAFIKLLLEKIENPEQIKPSIVLDNHSAHIQKDSVKLLQEHFNCFFLVPHSPQFNSIESLWMKIKERLATKLL